jgi:hypothetical protein
VNFGQLQVDLMRRGFDQLDQDRLKRWINEAYHEICTAAEWPFLETSVTAANPQTIADLRKVIAAHDATNRLPLRPTTRKWIVATYGDVASSTGSGRFYWVENTTVRAYPVIAGSTTVYYLKVPADLAAATDVPVIPPRFHSLITDGAVRRAFEDLSQFREAAALEQSRLARLEFMKSVLITTAPLPDVDDQAQEGVPGMPPAPVQTR